MSAAGASPQEPTVHPERTIRDAGLIGLHAYDCWVDAIEGHARCREIVAAVLTPKVRAAIVADALAPILALHQRIEIDGHAMCDHCMTETVIKRGQDREDWRWTIAAPWPCPTARAAGVADQPAPASDPEED